jgi:serine protease Do
LTVQTLTAEVAEQFGVAATEGVIVVDVDTGLPASVKNLRRGDVITTVDKKQVTTAKQFQEAVKRANPRKGIDVNFKRDGKPRFETLKEGSN